MRREGEPASGETRKHEITPLRHSDGARAGRSLGHAPGSGAPKRSAGRIPSGEARTSLGVPGLKTPSQECRSRDAAGEVIVHVQGAQAQRPRAVQPRRSAARGLGSEAAVRG